MAEGTEFTIQLEGLFSELELEDVTASQTDLVLFPESPVQDITKRIQARRQQSAFRDLVENALDAISISDLEGHQTYSNRACYEVFGYDYEGQEMDDLPLASLWPEDEAPLVDQLLHQVTAGRWSGEVLQKRRDGNLFDAHVTMFPVLDNMGQPTGIATIIRDISAQKALEREREQAQQRRARQVQRTTEVAQDISAAPTLDELHRRVVTLVKERLGYDHVQIFRYDPQLDAMVVVGSSGQTGVPTMSFDRKPLHGGGIVDMAAALGQSILVPDVSRDSHCTPHPDFPDAQGELAVPLKVRGRMLGVLDVLSDKADVLTREDEILLTDLAGQIASAMESTQLLEEANVLRQFAKAPEGIGWITVEGNLIIYVNPTLCSILGENKPEDTFGKPIISYYPEHLKKRMRNEVLPTVMQEGQWIGELAFVSSLGQITPTIQSIFLIRDENGNPLYLANVVTDITRQKQAEALLEKSARQNACLNDVGRKLEEAPPIPELLEWVAKRIPAAMQHPAVCLAAVEFEGQLYGAAKTVNLPCRIVEGLQVGGELAGQIYVSYTEEHAFPKDDRALLADIARRVSSHIESRRLLEQTRTTLDDVRATHQLYRLERWTERTPAQVSHEKRIEPEGVAVPDDNGVGVSVGLVGRLQNSHFYAELRKMLQRMTTGLFALLAVLLLGAVLAWTIRHLVRAGPPAAMAVALPSSSGPATLMVPSPTRPATMLDAPAQPTQTPLKIATPSPPTDPTDPTAVSSPSPTDPPPPSPLPAAPVVPAAFPAPETHNLATLSMTLPIPTPVPPVPVAADAINIVVLGSDRRPDWSEWHTDAVHVVSIQRDRGTVSVISIPRDIYLYIPSFWMSRINFADYYGEAYGYEGGGLALVQDTLLYNLGIRVDHFARTNFDGLIGIVDTVGGVDIPVHCRLSDYWPYPDENGEYPILTLEPGMHHLDGETALWYARSRKTTSVFSRERRQQQVLQALWHRAREAGLLTQIPALWKQGQGMVETDLTFTDILDLARIALTLRDQDVRFYNIGAGAVTPWTTPYGGSVFLPRWEKIQPLVAEAMAPVPEARLNRVYMPIEVWNGTPNPDWDLLAADRLHRAGYTGKASKPDRQDYTETQLIVFSENLKGTGVEYLQETFQIADEQVIHQPGESAEYGFRLIIGADYQPCPYLR
jgi:LCP family protein required for cell wall assembly/PAS domain S-box-containing protein